ncbi:sporulation protein RMD8 [Venturia nashicola]|uniref:Sporulation protein RMD8 n=1 Tax=Venturia nashicola TaxID=86259 RepID=A0A4Z1PTF9_9PEZI|nr:sporulation protein RMD8 [Venturia nashicola]TLD38496.1 sporulation protein RMD8 [Venturia nashicola]
MAAPNTKSKRGPTVLVTDAREAAWKASRGGPKGASQRPQMGERAGTGIISVDRILQYASDIPSAQRRGPPEARPKVHNRTPSGRHPLDPKLSGRLLPQQIPTRTSKVSEKLVILPETDELEEEKQGFETDGQDAPPTDQELERRKAAGADDKSEAERMPKSKRTEMLSRVTAYCTAQAFKLQATANFAKKHHHARTKLYDDCLYCVYHLPLLGGTDGYRIRSSPTLKNPGGKSVLDEEIERNERREYHEGYFGDTESYGIRGHDRNEDVESPRNGSARSYSPSPGDSPKRSISPPRIGPSALSFAEMFVYSYGVVVFWNFTERQEKDILADLTFAQNETGISLVSRPQEADSFETEEFHFEYNPHIARPRIFNDMITLRSGDHMVKLTMSHALAQSTKLSFFEEGMERTMHEAQYVPRRLALTGRLGMNRAEVVKILGRLFQSRVDVNLSSNVLDVPNFFWDSEPTLHPLYSAVREYLEIKPRIQVLNERCRVFLDLAEILSDSIADTKMTKITWIIIVLIVLSIFVTVSEVFLRFAILNGEKAKNPGEGVKAMMEVVRPTFAGMPVKTTRSFARIGLIASWGLVAVSCF